jgi:hypothetical protein
VRVILFYHDRVYLWDLCYSIITWCICESCAILSLQSVYTVVSVKTLKHLHHWQRVYTGVSRTSLSISSAECRYLIKASWCVSGIIFIRYAQNRKIGRPNNIKGLGRNKTKGINTIVVRFFIVVFLILYLLFWLNQDFDSVFEFYPSIGSIFV